MWRSRWLTRLDISQKFDNLRFGFQVKAEAANRRPAMTLHGLSEID
jgi:hypothetical protein